MQENHVGMSDLYLFVLADLRGRNFPDKQGTADARRMILPLDPERWNDVRTIRVRVNRDGIVCLTPFKKSSTE